LAADSCGVEKLQTCRNCEGEISAFVIR
jgi:hypothetical protein